MPTKKTVFEEVCDLLQKNIDRRRTEINEDYEKQKQKVEQTSADINPFELMSNMSAQVSLEHWKHELEGLDRLEDLVDMIRNENWKLAATCANLTGSSRLQSLVKGMKELIGTATIIDVFLPFLKSGGWIAGDDDNVTVQGQDTSELPLVVSQTEGEA